MADADYIYHQAAQTIVRHSVRTPRSMTKSTSMEH
nr:hypothetical protein [Halomicrobium sp. IBSBa]